jgi:DNA polymerase elongation subunit (family B)
MQYNISPDTFVEGKYTDTSVDQIIEKRIPECPKEEVLTANGYHYIRNRQGFLPKMMQMMYNERVLYKQKMIEAQKELEEVNKQLKEFV